MSRRRILAAIIVFCLLLLLIWWAGQRRRPANVVGPLHPILPGPVAGGPDHPVQPLTPQTPSLTPGSTPNPAHTPRVNPLIKPLVPVPVKPPPPVAPPPMVLPPPPPPAAPPPPIIAPSEKGLHKELIPRNISIVRCYYEQEVVGPGTRFGFDINGSGFDAAFQQMIQVDFDALDVDPVDLKLVTANQIHGSVQVGDAATTQYIYPQILIRGLPVFRAPQPFGVVRPGEVLDIQLTNIDETGQAGQFRVITNLDALAMKRLKISPTTQRLEVGDLTPRLPFYIDGVLRISPGLSSGEYGLNLFMGSHLVMKKDPLVDVVHPDVGRTGTVESIKADQAAHRPGDELTISVRGSGFTTVDAAALSGKVDGFEMGAGQLTYISAGQMRLLFHIPGQTPQGLYGVSLFQKNRTVFQRKTVFAIVPPNWLNTVKLVQPIHPGGRAVAQLQGRDLSLFFVQALKVEADEPGLAISAPRLQDPMTAIVDVSVSSDVAPGDYILHVSSGSSPLKLPGGNIIQVTP